MALRSWPERRLEGTEPKRWTRSFDWGTKSLTVRPSRLGHVLERDLGTLVGPVTDLCVGWPKQDDTEDNDEGFGGPLFFWGTQHQR
jgi:hypothetical protein